MPVVARDFPAEEAALSRIAFKYINTEDDLNTYLASSHLITPRPNVLVVDDFASYFLHSTKPDGRAREDRELLFSLNHSLSLLHDAVTHSPYSSPPPMQAPAQQELPSPPHEMSAIVAAHLPAGDLLTRAFGIYCRHRADIFLIQQKSNDLHLLHKAATPCAHPTSARAAEQSDASSPSGSDALLYRFVPRSLIQLVDL